MDDTAMVSIAANNLVISFNDVNDFTQENVFTIVSAETTLISSEKKDQCEGKWIPLTEFEPFPKLPLELRQMIWKSSLDDLETNSIFVSSRMGGILLNYTPPALLHACLESRSVASTTYHAEFANNLGKNGLNKGPVYFNFSKDALEFATVDAMYDFFGSDFKREKPCKDTLSKAMKQNLKYLIVSIGLDYRFPILNPQSYKVLGQPKHLFFVRESGPTSKIERGYVKYLKAAKLTGSVDDYTSAVKVQSGGRGANEVPASGRRFKPTIQTLTQSELKRRLYFLEKGRNLPRPKPVHEVTSSTRVLRPRKAQPGRV
ncbi:uncharacterized protein RCO7_03256 [Rhynchosporium graminicola]|uniref:2EXR domain-containing protein n=1 Tax=Rhynchosporium graminicola TaxID=2792576 RepID=A0A1E1LI53_9HELO|nr:uncharacterized protein RCO7_03256 [Rhynchosporium commune]